MATLVWFRDDLRLADHSALLEACDGGEGIVALFILDEESCGVRPLGGASKWWLHHSLTSLRDRLAERGIPLIIRRGVANDVIVDIVAETKVTSVFWNRRYGVERHNDAELKKTLRATGIEVRSFRGNVLYEPWTINTKSGTPYRIHSAYWRACREAAAPPRPVPEPVTWKPASRQPASETIDEWALLPLAPNWASEFDQRWSPGEREANTKLDLFLAERVNDYAIDRNFPAIAATSDLSPHLRWGEISSRTAWHRAVTSGNDVASFLSELGWREFAWYTLYHHSDLHTSNLDSRFDDFPWRWPSGDEASVWKKGCTGFPLVDAGMRELWRTGTMHNRVRMVVASFLTKNMLVHWRVGESWFWDTLVDADAANNPFNWQWVAGCGLDAAPYFRIFNPVTQQKKFDPSGGYVERWGDGGACSQVLDLASSRRRALDAYDGVK